MYYSVASSAAHPLTLQAPSTAPRLVRTVANGTFSLEPESKGDELQQKKSFFSAPKQLTDEEKKRVLYLQNLLSQILTMVDGQPTDKQKTRIREIEQELEKITGIKRRSSVSSLTAKMPGEKKDDDEKATKEIDGIDPKEAIHANRIEEWETEAGIMTFIRQNALQTRLKGIQLPSLQSLGVNKG